MPGTTTRRAELVEGATDWVLAHGLIGLSLRPLAADLGTSDRMLLYHFEDKDDLVAAVLRCANQRAVDGLAALPASASPGAGVHDLWRALSSPGQVAHARVYVEASALGVLGREPYRSVVLESNEGWWAAVTAHFRAAGLGETSAADAAALVDPALMGLLLDQPLEGAPGDRRHRERRDRTLDLLARAVDGLASLR